MKIHVNFIHLIIAVASCLISYFFIKISNPPVILQLLYIIYILYLPGSLILLFLQTHFDNIWHYIFHSLGISIFLLYLLGLGSSFLLPLIGYQRPLDLISVSFVLTGLVLLLIVISSVRNRNRIIDIVEIASKFLSLLGYIFGISVSSIAIIGATQLNNSGSNLLVILWILVLAIIYSFFSILKKKELDFVKPYIIFSLSLSVLWSLSARSSGLVGWDIIQELIVAKTTILAGSWRLEDVKDAYNACLSISVLPTIISNISFLSVESLFKYLYPFIFAHFPVIIYFFLNRYSNKNSSFLSIFYIIAQPFFIQPMVALARQEIAFFFFSLLLLVIFTDTVKNKTKILFTIIYLLSLVTSHYSTTYISVVLFTSAYLIILALSILKFVPVPNFLSKLPVYKNWFKSYTSSLKMWTVLLLILFTYVWYFLFTKTAGNVTATFTESIANMSDLFKGEQQNQEIQQIIPGTTNTTITTQEGLNAFEKRNVSSLHNIPSKKISFISERYPIFPLYENIVPSKLSNRNTQSIHRILNFLKDVLKILLIVGAFIIFVRTFFKATRNQDLVVFSTVSTFILLITLLHPTLGAHYNISRILVQLVIFLSIALITGIDSILWLIKEPIRRVIISILILITFLNLQGIFLPVIGGVAALQFYNQGTDFEKFYMLKAELNGVNWLEKNRDIRNTIYGDTFAGLRVRKETGLFTNPTILPVVLANDALGYVYLSRTNKVDNKTQVSLSGRLLRYVYPTPYLNDHKNLVYSNRSSSVYK